MQENRQLLFPIGQLCVNTVQVSPQALGYLAQSNEMAGCNQKACGSIPYLVSNAINIAAQSVNRNHARLYQWNVIARNNFANPEFSELCTLIMAFVKVYYLRPNPATETEIAAIAPQALEWHCGMLAVFTPALLQTLPLEYQQQASRAVTNIQGMMSELQQRIAAQQTSAGSFNQNAAQAANGGGGLSWMGQSQQKAAAAADDEPRFDGYIQQAEAIRQRKQQAVATTAVIATQPVRVFVSPHSPYRPLINPATHVVQVTQTAVAEVPNAVYRNYNTVELTQQQKEAMDRSLHEAASSYSGYELDHGTSFTSRANALSSALGTIAKFTEVAQTPQKTPEVLEQLDDLSLFRSKDDPLEVETLTRAVAEVQTLHKLNLQSSYFGTAYTADVILSRPFVCLSDYTEWLAAARKVETILALAGGMKAGITASTSSGNTQDFRNFLIALDRHLTKKLNWAFRHLFSLENLSIDSLMHDAQDIPSALLSSAGSFVANRFMEYQKTFIQKFLSFSSTELTRQEEQEGDAPTEVSRVHLMSQDMLCTVTNLDVCMSSLKIELPSGQVRQIIEHTHPQLYKFAKTLVDSLSPQGYAYTHHILVTNDDYMLEVARGALNPEAIVIAHTRF